MQWDGFWENGILGNGILEKWDLGRMGLWEYGILRKWDFRKCDVGKAEFWLSVIL